VTTPQAVAAVAALFDDFEGPWALCGGWAIDAWIGRQTRTHLDVDVAISTGDQARLLERFADGWLLLGHDPFDDDSDTPWDGHRLVVPAHVHARGHGLDLDVQLNDVDGDAWVLRRAPRLTRAAAQCVRLSRWGLPTLAPELLLLFKADGDIRDHDEADFRALEPHLVPEERAWLRVAIAARDQAHPWVAALAESDSEAGRDALGDSPRSRP